MNYYFVYSDGGYLERIFPTIFDAKWFALNEGDNLIDWGIVE